MPGTFKRWGPKGGWSKARSFCPVQITSHTRALVSFDLGMSIEGTAPPSRSLGSIQLPVVLPIRSLGAGVLGAGLYRDA